MEHMTIQQCGITRDATVQVLIRGMRGMIDSVPGAISTPYLTANKGSGFLGHLGTPPNGLARPPPPPSLPVEQDNTAPGKTTKNSTHHVVDNLLQSAVRQGLQGGGGGISLGENFAGKISPLRKVAKFSPGEILA